MKLKKIHVKLLAQFGDLTSRERVPNCAKLLVKHGVDSYPGLWSDISKAIDQARDIAQKNRETKLNKLKNLQQLVADKIGKKSWLAVDRMNVEMLKAEADKIRRNELRSLVEALIQRKSKPKKKASCPTPIHSNDVRPIYFGSDGARSRRLHTSLEKTGDMGRLAACCLKAQKTSDRAKEYRGEFKDHAYDRKQIAICDLVGLLGLIADELNICWGWGSDPDGFCKWVLYVDLPTGQVSWHSPTRLCDKDYCKQWDGTHESCERILRFAIQILDGLKEPSESCSSDASH